MASIVPSERVRRELDEIVAGVGEEDDPIEAIGRIGARLILQKALEEELSEFLSRERYERRGKPIAHRNGYERVTVKTTAGPLELARPRVRNASALGFCSEIVGKGVARTRWRRWSSAPSCAGCRSVTSRRRWRKRSTVRWCRSRRSVGSVPTRASATGPGAGGGWTSTISSTSSSMPST